MLQLLLVDFGNQKVAELTGNRSSIVLVCNLLALWQSTSQTRM
jgi:hypothetical protein